MKVEKVINEMVDKDKVINYEIEFICKCKLMKGNEVIKEFKMPLHQFAVIKNIFNDRIKRIN